MSETARRSAGQSGTKYRNQHGTARPLTRMTHDHTPPPPATRTSGFRPTWTEAAYREYGGRCGVLLRVEEGRVVRMHQNYCFKCGCYTAIYDATKLCVSCYERWAGNSKPQVSAAL